MTGPSVKKAQPRNPLADPDCDGCEGYGYWQHVTFEGGVRSVKIYPCSCTNVNREQKEASGGEK